MSDLAALNERFAMAGLAGIKVGEHGAEVLEITHPRGSGSIALQGAQILTWAPAGQAPAVWLSPAAAFKPGKSLRGGAPVCWPWFGPHPRDAEKPAHGFARNRDWSIVAVESGEEGVQVSMRFDPNAAEQAMWPHRAELMLEVSLGERLKIELITRNAGDAPIVLTQAIHTYFHVGDIAEVRVEGLEGVEYIDKMSADARIRQEGPILIDGEVNRIYLDCPGEAAIVDQSLNRRIRISKEGSRSYVVWNPWAETGAKFGDMGEDGYRRMLCVETTNAATDSVDVGPGERFRLVTEYSLESL